jgi:membrane protein
VPDPAPLPRGSYGAAARRAWHGFIRHRGIDAAAALTFYTALATLPALLVLVSAFAFFDDRDRAAADLAAIASTVLPDDAALDIERGLRELLSLANPGIALAAGIVLLLWTVAGYATAFGRVVNTVYEVEEGRQFWTFRARMLLVAVGLVVVQTGIVAILLVTPSVADDIFGRRGLAPVVTTAWNWGKWPLLLVLLVLFAAMLYYFTPNVRHTRVRWASAGSLAAIAIWVVATLGFALYIVIAGHYNALYGSLGGIVIALVWGYLTNAALVAGAELDAEFVRLRQLARGEPAEEIVRLPLRDSSRNRMLARQRDHDVAAARRIRDSVENEES